MSYVRPISPRRMVAAVGQRLKRLRLSRRQSQEDLASAAGISVRTLRRIEAEGDGRLESVARVALALRVQDQFENLFIPEETRSLDEMLDAQHLSMRVRKSL